MDQLAGLHQMMNDFADRLDRLNEQFPDLATPVTRASVESWRKGRFDDALATGDQGLMDTAEPGPESPAAEPVDLSQFCMGLLQDNGLEDILDIVTQEHGVDLTISQLVDLIGRETYIAVLKRDVKQLSQNAISYEQIASLWNELGRPALAGPTWTGRSISVLAR